MTTNAQRAEWAEIALEEFANECGPPIKDDNGYTVTCDLICGLLHYLQSKGHSVDDCIAAVQKAVGMWHADDASDLSTAHFNELRKLFESGEPAVPVLVWALPRAEGDTSFGNDPNDATPVKELHTDPHPPVFEKFIRDDKVAVLISPGYGTGWSTANTNNAAEPLLFDRDLVSLVLNGYNTKAGELAQERYGHLDYNGDLNLLGVHDLQVCWLDPGAQFVVEEYDGSESLCIRDDVPWHTA